MFLIDEPVVELDGRAFALIPILAIIFAAAVKKVSSLKEFQRCEVNYNNASHYHSLT